MKIAVETAIVVRIDTTSFRTLARVTFLAGFLLSAIEVRADPQWSPPKSPRSVTTATKEGHQRAMQFLKERLKDKAPPLTAAAVDAFCMAKALYREGHFDACQSMLARFWAAYPRDLPDWNNQSEDALGLKLGFPAAYPGLILLTDAVAWRVKEKQLKRPVEPIDWNLTVILVGKSRGLAPANDKERLEGKGREMTGTIDQSLVANNHALIHDLFWLTREYYHAVTEGKLHLRLDVMHLADLELPVGGAQSSGVPQNVDMVRDALSPEMRRRLDWCLVVYPEIRFGPGKDDYLGWFPPEGITNLPGTPITAMVARDSWLTQETTTTPKGPRQGVASEIYFSYWVQHESFHDHYGRNPHLELEATSHSWFKRETWAKDFVGRFEPDYYHETMFKRLQTQAKPSLAGYFIRRSDFSDLHAKLKPEAFVGRYSIDKVENGWHTGEIRSVNGNDGKPALEWKNDAGKVWGLTLKEGGVLQTDDRNPYRENDPNFKIELARGADGLPEARPGGFRFGNSVYKRVEAPRR